MDDIMTIFKSLLKSFLHNIGGSFLGSILAGKGVIKAADGIIRVSEGKKQRVNFFHAV